MDKYKQGKEEIKKKFREGYADGARHRRDEEKTLPFAPKDGIHKTYKEGFRKGYTDADKAFEELERNL